MAIRFILTVDVRRAIDQHAAYSPLDRLTRGAKGSHRDESWGWRP